MNPCSIPAVSALRSNLLTIARRCSLALVTLFLLCLPGTNQPPLSAAEQQRPATASSTSAMLVLDQLPGWFSAATNLTVKSLAWGDVDSDSDLDLAVGTYGQPNYLYLNDNGKLQTTPAWTSTETDNTTSIAWGDMNGDGKLDLAVGNEGQPNRVYKNVGTMLETTATWWNASEAMSTRSIALGDANGDGRFDLAVGNYDQINQLYFNSAKGLPNVSNWNSLDVSNTTSIVWCDFNKDNRLDLAVGNRGQSVHIHLNTATGLPISASWGASDGGQIESVACADLDKNGYLDLLAGNVAAGQSSRIYYNQNGQLPTTATYGFPNYVTALAIGDADNDGNLDLAAGEEGSVRVYRNDGGGGSLSGPLWSSSIGTTIIAWADIDGDDDLDLAAGGVGPVRIHYNHSVSLEAKYHFTEETNLIGQTAWGDIDGDGDLDLAAAVGLKTKVYRNDDRQLNPFAVWVSLDNEGSTNGQAWGDVDGDGDLDLATPGYGPTQRTRIYYNTGQTLQITATWRSAVSEYSNNIAWGDVDGDGDLDLASGNLNRPNTLYINDNGVLRNTPSWYSNDNDNTNSIAWGDMDGDGDLDLAAGNRNPNSWTGASEKVYLNVGGTLQTTPIWVSSNDDNTNSIAWGDVDGDGDLDLATGNDKQPTKLYLNQTGILQTTPAWSFTDVEETSDVAWGDFDNDGDLDLFAIPFSRIYLNENGQLYPVPIENPDPSFSARHLAVGDMDHDGDIDISSGPYLYTNHKSAHVPTARPSAVAIRLLSSPVTTFRGYQFSALAPTNFYGVPVIRQSAVIPITYDLFHPTSEPIGAIRSYYSLDGALGSDRTRWRVAQPAPGTQTTDLSTSLYPIQTATSQHTFHWDVSASGFFGQSDNVVLRLEALPSLKPVTNAIPGPFQRPYVAAQTFPFRVRGSQIRVMRADNIPQPVKGAIVYRLPANQVGNGLPFRNQNGNEFRTDQYGYLQGRGVLTPGDRLIALVPISATTFYTLYHTSAAPTADGLAGLVITTTSAQTLTVAASNPLILFNPTISLEWDARNDPTFMTQLENDLRRTSQILFDLTNGQAALGDVRIYHDKGFWGTADVVITASNNQRPNAILGGSVLTATGDVDIQGKPIVDAYVPGQVRMGATWNRFGNPNGTLGEDWPRTLAHELGHYLFFVPDNYIGVTPDRQFIQIVDCLGSVMTDPYEESYSEFLTADQWQTDACQRSVAAVYLGRPDWATITRFYPMLNGRGRNPGPAQLPLAVTRITTFAPSHPTTTLAAPFFPLVNQEGQTISVPDGRGQAYLFKTGIHSDPTDDYVIFLGTPIGDLVQARGATPGDRLCVFDYAHEPLRLGCLASVGSAPAPITLAEVPDWSPQIQVSAVTTNTVIVTVTNANVDNLAIQLLPSLGVASAEIPMTLQGDDFVQTVTAADGAYFGFVRIWVLGSNPLKEIIVEYSANEAWDGRARAWGTSGDAWGGRARAWGGRAYSWGGRARAWGAPVMSNDGQVSIFPLDNPFAGGAHYTLQSVAFPPGLPSWLTGVGQAYRVASDGTLAHSAILISYLGRDVPDGYENFLAIYYSPDEGRSWQHLPTDLDTNRNQASAPVLGEGIYLLVVTVPVDPALATGWNNFGYPIQATQSVTQALVSIAGKYSVIYHYRSTPAPDWQTFAPNVSLPFDKVVNNLTHLELGRAYWLYATEPTQLYLGVSNGIAASRSVAAIANVPSAPATYYGWVASEPNFTPTEGMPVIATIDGVVCGQTTVQSFNGLPGYVLRVAANEPQDGMMTCGESGKVITLTIGGVTMAQTAIWNNQDVLFLPLSQTSGLNHNPFQTTRVFLPLVHK